MTTLRGNVVVHKGHALAKNSLHFSITPCLQELICFVGMQHTYGNSTAILKKLLGIEVTGKQVERVCLFYGKKLYESQCAVGLRQTTGAQKPGILYVLMDGSFVAVRGSSLPASERDAAKGKDCWKEVKLARLVDGRHIVKGVGKDRGYVSHCGYLVHLGAAEPFLGQLRQSIDNRKYDRLVFLCDGAKWIWNWVEGTYPGSVQVLDYFHAMEHISEYAQMAYPEEQQRKDWAGLQQSRLLSDDIEGVIKELSAEKKPLAANPSKPQQEALDKLTAYLAENIKRMAYKTFKKQNIEIGSGAIESAHRTIIQQRAKLSGQRWTVGGVQSILSLRAAYHSGRWDELINLIKTA